MAAAAAAWVRVRVGPHVCARRGGPAGRGALVRGGARTAAAAAACPPVARRAVVGMAAAHAVLVGDAAGRPARARAPPPKPAEASAVVAADGGFAFTAPTGFRVAANRQAGGRGASETLAIATDLRRFAVISVRVEPWPATLADLLDNATVAPSPQDLARAITQPLADAVVLGTTESVDGVVNGESGTVAFELVGAAATSVPDVADSAANSATPAL